VARRVDDPEACVVAVLCDTGERYLSKVFNDEWLKENQLLEPERVTAGQLLATKEAGAPALVSVTPVQTARQALNLMETYDVSQVPIVDGGVCIGAVTEGTLMARAIAQPAALERQVREIMEPSYPVVDVDLPIERLSELLSRETSAVLVQEREELVGILTRYDVLHHMVRAR
jgi:cystathionine beta-synthase